MTANTKNDRNMHCLRGRIDLLYVSKRLPTTLQPYNLTSTGLSPKLEGAVVHVEEAADGVPRGKPLRHDAIVVAVEEAPTRPPHPPAPQAGPGARSQEGARLGPASVRGSGGGSGQESRRSPRGVRRGVRTGSEGVYISACGSQGPKPLDRAETIDSRDSVALLSLLLS
eukprot:546805-Prorocentrum_minimum.AAC.2